MNIQLVADSSANIHPGSKPEVNYAPLHITTSEREFIDDDNLDIHEMLAYLKTYNGKSGTACPSVHDWKELFNGADMAFGVAITSGLSGSYNAGAVAAQEYMKENPGKKAFILDSRSTGPEMTLILEKYQELIDQGLNFEQIVDAIQEYHKHTHLIFALACLDNLAKNGRVSPVVAKIAGMLGIRVVGIASPEGTLDPQHKCRGEKRSLDQMITMMTEFGFQGTKARISHSCAEEAAEKLKSMILEKWPTTDVTIMENRGLCTFYAEEGDVLLGID